MMDWKKEEEFNGIFKPKFCFFFFEIFKGEKRRKKNKSDKTLFTSYFLGVRTKKKKEGRKETERIYIRVCPMCCV